MRSGLQKSDATRFLQKLQRVVPLPFSLRRFSESQQGIKLIGALVSEEVSVEPSFRLSAFLEAVLAFGMISFAFIILNNRR
ncbi:MAG: hypothetical protein KTR25_05850 [Myxococcales bacterium]|nr:hypothetical protein [Myxococcales bacterium]